MLWKCHAGVRGVWHSAGVSFPGTFSPLLKKKYRVFLTPFLDVTCAKQNVEMISRVAVHVSTLPMNPANVQKGVRPDVSSLGFGRGERGEGVKREGRGGRHEAPGRQRQRSQLSPPEK
ncbi:hypothetical protein E2C01_039834 [Portunus trituberculatus]|uniref:Uncharacterized protein n=1 Tax=Portunus trituberculatus TaxID=210409 RepID=A0A5B7FL27_PORTR|nr:hypothetical protein [Portunus trituberculatus]